MRKLVESLLTFNCAAGVVLAGGLVVACGDETPTGPAIAVEAQVLSTSEIEAGLGEAAEVRGTRTGSTSPRSLAGLGAVPAAAAGPLNLEQTVPGGSTTLSFDIDGDAAEESLNVFVVSNGPTLVAWTKFDHCYLAYEDAGTSYYFDGVCGQTGTIVCAYDGAVSCQYCDDEECAPCAFTADDSQRVACEVIPEPEPEPEPDAAPSDAGSEDTSADTDGPDIAEDVAPDVVPDTTESGACTSECMAGEGATCCTTCGCDATACLPQCDAPFAWDCETQCCFNYETFECQ